MSTESIHEHGLKRCEKVSPVIGQQLAHEYFDVISFSFLFFFFFFLIIFYIFTNHTYQSSKVWSTVSLDHNEIELRL